MREETLVGAWGGGEGGGGTSLLGWNIFVISSLGKGYTNNYYLRRTCC